jgi:hypothetical protein
MAAFERTSSSLGFPAKDAPLEQPQKFSFVAEEYFDRALISEMNEKLNLAQSQP